MQGGSLHQLQQTFKQKPKDLQYQAVLARHLAYSSIFGNIMHLFTPSASSGGIILAGFVFEWTHIEVSACPD